MSDNWVCFVPTHPRFTPCAVAVKAAEATVRKFCPRAGEIEAEVFDSIRFIDAGANWQSVSCPRCGFKLDDRAWGDWMDEDHTPDAEARAERQAFGEYYSPAKGFKLAPRAMACCGASVALNELVYDWPCAFGKFSLEIMNAGFDGEYKSSAEAWARKLEPLLGCKLTIVYRHF